MLNSNEKKELFNNNYLLNDIDNKKKEAKFAKDSLTVFIVAIICSLVGVAALYFVTPFSKTYKVVVKGNIYIKSEDIEREANPSKFFLLTFPNKIEKTLEENPLIEDAEVKMLNGNIVSINVKEVKEIGYIFEDNEPRLLLVNDERITITKDNMYLIDKVPLITGYTKEELTRIEKGFRDVDYKIIDEISEIHKYPVSYDDIQMEVIMRDGNYCFLSNTSIKLLENYYMISSSIDSSKGNVCAYFDDFTNSAYISSCPWQIENEEIKVDEEKENQIEDIDENKEEQ